MSQFSNPTSSLDPSTPDANELVSRVAQGVHETVDRLADKAAPVAQKLESTVAHANEALHDQMHRAREVGDEWSESLRVRQAWDFKALCAQHARRLSLQLDLRQASLEKVEAVLAEHGITRRKSVFDIIEDWGGVGDEFERIEEFFQFDP